MKRGEEDKIREWEQETLSVWNSFLKNTMIRLCGVSILSTSIAEGILANI